MDGADAVKCFGTELNTVRIDTLISLQAEVTCTAYFAAQKSPNIVLLIKSFRLSIFYTHNASLERVFDLPFSGLAL